MRVQEVEFSTNSPEELAVLLRPYQAKRFLAKAEAARDAMAGRVVWNVNSTAAGGGVAEMLHGFLRYVRGAAVDARWLVIGGSPQFFEVTKRIHNRLHGEPGDDKDLGDNERRIYQRVLDSAVEDVLPLVRAPDVVILHDPQTAGLAAPLRQTGATVIWRCHVGSDHSNRWTEQAWAFLRPYVAAAHASVFSRATYMPAWLAGACSAIIAPCIDPLTAKNRPLNQDTILDVLGRAGILASGGNRGGRSRTFGRQASALREGGPVDPTTPIVLQISRWDRLKDMAGVLRGFVESDIAKTTGAHLLLAGPDVSGVRDDPEGRQVLAECVALWRGLDASRRSTVSLVCVPMDDLEENATIVNALQRHARIIVQKSLREGFGLTVSEGMWKGRPIVASDVGGIQDQVRDGVDGLLLTEPTDLDAFAGAVSTLLADQRRADEMGASGYERVRDHFLADRDLNDWMALLERLL